jgi:hypothetical protein
MAHPKWFAEDFRADRLARRIKKFCLILHKAAPDEGGPFHRYEVEDTADGDVWPGPKGTYRANLGAIEAWWDPIEKALTSEPLSTEFESDTFFEESEGFEDNPAVSQTQ